MVRPLHPAWRPLIALFLTLTAISTIALYVLAEHTDRYFAWTIRPPMSAAFLGGGYAAGFVLTVLTAREQIWANARLGLLTVALFTWLTLVPTLIHLDRFHFNADSALAVFAAWLWTVVYVVVPVWMTVVVWVQARVKGGDPLLTRPLASTVSAVLVVQAVILVLTGAALMVVPQAVNVVWPWDLTPLTGRVIGAWLLPLGFAAIYCVRELDLRRLRAAAVTYVTFGVLQYGALIRFSGDVHWERPSAWLWVVLLASFIAVGLYGWIQALHPSAAPA